MDAIVGYTGFVGSNLCLQHKFNAKYNSKNIQDAYGTKPDLLVYAGVPAQKFIANTNPEKDAAVINGAIQNIEAIAPKSLVLISTIDVYREPLNVDENSKMETEGLEPYGLNRLRLEDWARENREHFDRLLIIRLPGLFGHGLKKNFIYDLIHIIPSMLNQQKYDELSQKSDLIKKEYLLQDNGFYKTGEISDETRKALKQTLQSLGFTALNFTDSRASFQFYHLGRLWADINTALKAGMETLNLATPPVNAAEVYHMVTGETFTNELNRPVPNYDFKTVYDDVFGGEDGYIDNKPYLLEQISQYIKTETRGDSV